MLANGLMVISNTVIRDLISCLLQVFNVEETEDGALHDTELDIPLENVLILRIRPLPSEEPLELMVELKGCGK